MKKTIFNLSLLALLSPFSGIAQQPVKSQKKYQDERIWHYSMIDAMRRGIYEGTHTVKELKTHGDFGLGTFNHLDGELIALDGIVYRIQSSGKVEVASENLKSPFTSLTYFNPDVEKKLSFTGSFKELQGKVQEMLTTQNLPYAIKIEGTWADITVGGADPVSPDDTTELATLMKVRPQYKAKNIKGTMVGYFTPSLLSNVDLSPFHFHFISDDRKFAGHLMSGNLVKAELKIYLNEKSGYDIELLRENSRFRQLKFEGKEVSSVY
ncbi:MULTISPECIES: acetolactate decarboxylase [Chryseobacterium]|uniref:acetolactate decarboxylase n=1 Tax=Chryseobacterium TaxID=59732 RepID=UPI0012978AC2|nr:MULTISPECIES: acetolactate decarboxylase [Chryseobacterium]MDR6919833.1 acetolactate decarboxylase [Chryseobacterium sp. 2987]